MANFKYFIDTTEGTFQAKNVDHRGGKEGTWGFVAERGQWMKTTRCIQYKNFASKHVCDARCMGATGKTMNCECSCGGKNHGRGFAAEVAR